MPPPKSTPHRLDEIDNIYHLNYDYYAEIILHYMPFILTIIPMIVTLHYIVTSFYIYLDDHHITLY